MSGRLRLIGTSDINRVRVFLEADPVTNIFFLSRLEAAGRRISNLGHPIYGFWRRSKLVSVCHHGYNLVVCGDDDEAIAAFAQKLGPYRNTSSIMGESVIVAKLYEELVNRWGSGWAQPRDIRAHQPMLAIANQSPIKPDTRINRVSMIDYDAYLDAAVQMYTEEVGTTPYSGSGFGYRDYVRNLILYGRAFGAIDDGRFWYKSDIGICYDDYCQIQGVWVDPRLRGQGLSEAAMAQVVALAQENFSVVSLYVNDFNIRARKLYERVGFKQLSEFATVLY